MSVTGSTSTLAHRPLLRRLAEKSRASVAFTLDGAPAMALDGDTVLTAVLTQHDRLRRNEFSDAPRAGFCMMGACQDCWIATESGERLRACSTFIAPGMALLTGSDSLPSRGRAGVGASGVTSPHPSLPPGGERSNAGASSMNVDTAQPVIVGAGPAGIRAAQTLAAHGLRPVLIDEAARAGGQIYRRPPKHFKRPAATLYGTEAARATSLHDAIDGLHDRIDYLPDSLVWNAQHGMLDVLHGKTNTAHSVPYRRLIVATGATDRVLPVPGWTLPGVYTLGGAQVALKFQGCAIGERVVFMGTGPLLYLVAYQYKKAGADVVAVLDTARLADQIMAAPKMLTQPAVFAKGVYYVGWLRAHGVALHSGVRPVRIQGEGDGETRVSSVTFHDGKRERTLACDAVAFGYALRSETQLADLLGCRFAFAPMQRAHLPVRDAAGRSSVDGIYLAGDGAGIMGADAAEWAGERAALALLADQGVTVDNARAAELENKLARLAPFREGLERAFPFPTDWAAHAPDDLVVCRCENITAGTLRDTVRETGADEMNRLKALSRIGMGRCQGRMCAIAATEILAHATGKSIEASGRLRGQAPIKPIPMVLMRRPSRQHAEANL